MAMRLMLDPAVGGAAGGAAPAVEPVKAAAPAPVVAAAPAPVAPAAPAKVEEPVKPSFLSPPAKAEDKKPDAAAPAVDPAKPAVDAKKPDEKWTLKLPEGSTVKPEHLAKFEEEMKSLGLDAAAGQKILDRDLAHDAAQLQRYTTQMEGQSVKWHGDLKTRWGDKFPEMDAQVKKVFDHGDPTGKFRASLASMKLEYAPELIDFVERFVPLFADPKLNPPSQVGVTVQDTRSEREKLTEYYARSMKAQ